nr:uncharacterized protein LOC121468294 isoform X2 [Taeniopygia guttata]
MGFPWRAHPVGWPELCQWALPRNGVNEGTVTETCAVGHGNTTIRVTGFTQISRQEKPNPVTVIEATVSEDFCALPSLPMSEELGVLQLVSVSVTPLPAAGPPFRVLQQRPHGRLRAQRTFSTQRVPWVSESKGFWFTLCPMCAAPPRGVDMNELNGLLEEVVNDTVEMPISTSYELQQTQMGTPENRMALDYLLAGQGGTWAIRGRGCCTASSDGFEGQQSGITLTERAVEEWQKEENSSWWDWLRGCQIRGCCEMHSWQCLSSLQCVHLALAEEGVEAQKIRTWSACPKHQKLDGCGTNQGLSRWLNVSPIPVWS